MLKTPKTIIKLTTTALTVFTLFGLFFIFGFVAKTHAATYESTYESQLHSNPSYSPKYFGTISWNATVPATTSIAFQVRAGDSSDTTDSTWTAWNDVNNGDSLSQFDGKKYIQ